MPDDCAYSRPRHYFRWATRRGIRPESLKSALDTIADKPDLFPAIAVGRDVIKIRGQWYVWAMDLDLKLCL